MENLSHLCWKSQLKKLWKWYEALVMQAVCYSDWSSRQTETVVPAVWSSVYDIL